jgi:glycosyltransferase involved in cell wall biosynthesis
MLNNFFSVIIPTYNSKNYICETIDSVISQSYNFFEILLIDDFSNDEIELEINSRYSNSNVKLFVNKTKSGPNYSRNFGLSQAKGDYIIFLDSDDFLNKDALKILNEKLSHSNYDFIYFGFEFVSEKNKILGQHTFLSGEVSNDKLISDYFTGRISTVCWNKVYSSSFLTKNEITFIPDLIHGRDSLFILNCCLRAENVLFISDVLYYSTVRENSFSRVFTINNLNSIISNINLVTSISKNWNIDPKLVDLYVAKHIRYILLIATFRLSFINYLKGFSLFFKDKKIFVLFRYHVIVRNSLLKNIISILVCLPFLMFPLTWILNKFNIKPY